INFLDEAVEVRIGCCRFCIEVRSVNAAREIIEAQIDNSSFERGEICLFQRPRKSWRFGKDALDLITTLRFETDFLGGPKDECGTDDDQRRQGCHGKCKCEDPRRVLRRQRPELPPPLTQVSFGQGVPSCAANMPWSRRCRQAERQGWQ